MYQDGSDERIMSSAGTFASITKISAYNLDNTFATGQNPRDRANGLPRAISLSLLDSSDKIIHTELILFAHSYDVSEFCVWLAWCLNWHISTTIRRPFSPPFKRFPSIWHQTSLERTSHSSIASDLMEPRLESVFALPNALPIRGRLCYQTDPR